MHDQRGVERERELGESRGAVRLEVVPHRRAVRGGDHLDERDAVRVRRVPVAVVEPATIVVQ